MVILRKKNGERLISSKTPLERTGEALKEPERPLEAKRRDCPMCKAKEALGVIKKGSFVCGECGLVGFLRDLPKGTVHPTLKVKGANWIGYEKQQEYEKEDHYKLGKRTELKGNRLQEDLRKWLEERRGENGLIVSF